MHAEPPVESWKTQPYVWMLILIPFSAVVVGMIMLTLAIQSDTGLVVDDYYKKGKQINQVLARDQAASAMGLAATIDFDFDSGIVAVRLKANSTLITNEEVKLGLFHATKADMDQTVVLKANDQQVYSATLGELGDGRWHVHLATETWRLTGSLYVPGGSSMQLSAMPVN
jgi:hypothetical protein